MQGKVLYGIEYHKLWRGVSCAICVDKITYIYFFKIKLRSVQCLVRLSKASLVFQHLKLSN